MNSVRFILLFLIAAAPPALALPPAFPDFTSQFGPVTGYLAGNGIATTSTVPESSEWVPADEGAPATTVNLGNPHIAMADAWGNVYVAEKSNHIIRKIAPDGTATTFAGTHVYPYTGSPPSYAPPADFTTDGPAPATAVNLVACNGLYVLPNGVVYIYDAGIHRIRRVGLDGIMTTIVNDPDPHWLPSGRGLWVSPAEDLIYYTQEVANLDAPIPSDSINHPPYGGVVKKWTPTGGIRAITAYPAVPSDTNLELINPGNIDVNPLTGKLYVTDRAEDDATLTKSCVYRIDTEAADPATGRSVKTRVAGTFGVPATTPVDGSLATGTYLNQVRGISFTPTGAYLLCTHKGGQVWYVDSDQPDARIHLLVNGRGKSDVKYYGPAPLALPVTGTECHSQPRAVSVAPDGSILIVSNDSGLVRKLQFTGTPELPAIGAVDIPAAGLVHFAWTGGSGHSWIVQHSSTLLPGSWLDDAVSTASEFTGPAGLSREFFRLAAPR